jgi:uncharacterized protein (TIGR04255 family)
MNLPKFIHPPVVEVALSVQFQPVLGFTAAHIGLIWNKFRDRFPSVEQHVPIASLIERKGVSNRQLAEQFIFSPEANLTPRLWMINKSSDQLLQIQGDRFIRNWRKYHAPEIKYPSYAEGIRPAFQADFKQFTDGLIQLGLPELNVEQCEVTYINHIHSNAVWSDPFQPGRVFKGWSEIFPTLTGLKPEGLDARVRHEMLDKDGNFVGRLHIEMGSALQTADKKPLFVMQMVARGKPNGSNIEDVMSFMDKGHESIVRSFAELTTAAMHDVWGRTQ